ncbi:MAG: cation:proton antiporter [Rubrivivax sp.]|nr:cation:proton antiporter [Rubrivivax sp.]
MLETMAGFLQIDPWPPEPGTALYVALALVAGALLGEGVRRVAGWPRIVGYSAVGLLIAATGIGPGLALPATTRLIVDLALALLLFELGSRVDLRWWRANPALPLAGLAECVASLAAITVALRAFGLPFNAAITVATMTVCASAAVVGRVTSELGSAGQVTERMIVLTAINTLFAVLAHRLVTGWLHIDQAGDWVRAVSQTLWVFSGSVLLAIVLARLVAAVARRLELRDENAALLLLGLVVLALLAARALALSTLLVPLLAGVLLRNTTDRPWVWPRHFGTAGGVLVLMLFVVVGSAWSVETVLAGAAAALVVLAARAAAKTLAVVALARWSGLSWRQGFALSTGLLPLSATALVMLLELQLAHPGFAAIVAPVVLAAIVFTELPGPLAVQWGLRHAGDLGPRADAPPSFSASLAGRAR